MTAQSMPPASEPPAAQPPASTPHTPDTRVSTPEPPAIVAALTLVHALIDAGVRRFIVSPGSRSAPLAYAVAAAERDGLASVSVRIDERVAAFTALGCAHGGGELAAVITTSGTAPAHTYPAVLEAHHGRHPLLILSADRPAELRDTGANQTTNQVGMFGTALRWSVDVPAPTDADLEPGSRTGPRYWRNIATRAVRHALGGGGMPAGPVHLNLCYREPLVPTAWPIHVDDGSSPTGPQTGAAPASTGAGALPRTTTQHMPQVSVGANGHYQMVAGPRTVVVAGEGASREAAEVAARNGWPILAEPSSGLRGMSTAIAAYQPMLDEPTLGGRIERVVVLGRPNLSRAVTALLSRPIDIIVVDDALHWSDPTRSATVVASTIGVVGQGDNGGGPADGGQLTDAAPGDAWLGQWRDADGRAAAVIEQWLASHPLTGLQVARLVGESLRPEDLLYVGSSQPIRDLDLCLPQNVVGMIRAHRGLAGIDGTVSAATGAALSRHGAPVTALMGDLTFLHDVGGLVIGPLEDQPRLRIVVVNDDGGSIFTTLEPGDGRAPSVFERMFATPTGVDIAGVAAGMGVAHRRVRTSAELAEALAKPVSGREIVEAVVARSSRRAENQSLMAAARSAITGA